MGFIHYLMSEINLDYSLYRIVCRQFSGYLLSKDTDFCLAFLDTKGADQIRKQVCERLHASFCCNVVPFLLFLPLRIFLSRCNK